jgi:hypothetical protein
VLPDQLKQLLVSATHSTVQLWLLQKQRTLQLWSGQMGPAYHFGDTKLVASMTLSPLSDSLLMNSTLVLVGMVPGSFCNPSLGPTSTIVTLRGRLPLLLVCSCRTGVHQQQAARQHCIVSLMGSDDFYDSLLHFACFWRWYQGSQQRQSPWGWVKDCLAQTRQAAPTTATTEAQRRVCLL